MKKASMILAMSLSLSLVLSACGSDSVKSVKETPTQTSDNKEVTKDTSKETTGNKNTNDVANNDSSYNTAPNPLLMGKGIDRLSIDGQLFWHYNGNGVTIDKVNTGETELVIPATIKVNGADEKVTAIGEKAFEISGIVESITVPDSVVAIGRDAFANTLWLQNQPNGPLYIGGVLYSFVGGSPVGNFQIKDGTKTIRTETFKNSINLTSVTIPSGVTTIEDGAFSSCTGLTSITIPESVTTIGKNAFSGCTGLTSVKIPDATTTIGDGAFSNCTGLTSVTIPESVTTIGNGVFDNCNNLTDVKIPDSLMIAINAPFRGTSFYEKWYNNQPDGTMYVGTVLYDYKWTNRDEPQPELIVRDDTTRISISNFNIPINDLDFQAELKEFPVGLFTAYCDWLKNQPDGPVYFGKVFCGYKGDMPANTALEIKEGTVLIAEGTLSNRQTLTSIALADSVTTIGVKAFANCTGLSSIVIPKGVTIIGENAFGNCKGLTSIIIPKGVTVIEKSIFSGCTSLNSVTIPDGVTTIERNTFSGCAALSSITIPYNVTTIEDGAFRGSKNLTIKAPVGSRAQIYSLNEDNGVLFEAQ